MQLSPRTYATQAGIAAVSSTLGAGLALALALEASPGIALGTCIALAVASAAAVMLLLRIERRASMTRRQEQAILELLRVIASESTADELVHAVEASAREAFNLEYVELELDSARLGTRTVPPPLHSGFLAKSGSSEAKLERQLSLPLVFAGKPLGTLHVCLAQSRPAASETELDLLEILRKLALLGLALSQAQRELERRRGEQASAWRGEREALLETVAAEIAHEVRYPINFFRDVFERAARGHALELEDIEIGGEEIQRLERLVTGLRRMTTHKLERRPVHVGELCARAEALLREAFDLRRIQLNLEATPALSCDIHQATQILVNLLTNALEATDPVDQVGVDFKLSGSVAELTVWDTGRGFEGDPGKLFAPWYSTKQRGTGLGLAITQRLVRSHGWAIRALRNQHRTEFTISIRREDLIYEPAGTDKSDSRAEVA